MSDFDTSAIAIGFRSAIRMNSVHWQLFATAVKRRTSLDCTPGVRSGVARAGQAPRRPGARPAPRIDHPCASPPYVLAFKNTEKLSTGSQRLTLIRTGN
jgi:hypothetical protein